MALFAIATKKSNLEILPNFEGSIFSRMMTSDFRFLSIFASIRRCQDSSSSGKIDPNARQRQKTKKMIDKRLILNVKEMITLQSFIMHSTQKYCLRYVILSIIDNS